MAPEHRAVLALPPLEMKILVHHAKPHGRKIKDDNRLSKTADQPVKGLGDHVPAFMLRKVELS